MSNPPKKNSQKYKKIASLGCKLEYSNTDWGEEYDCGHGYEWDCDYCPCTIEYQKAQMAAQEVGENPNRPVLAGILEIGDCDQRL